MNRLAALTRHPARPLAIAAVLAVFGLAASSAFAQTTQSTPTVPTFQVAPGGQPAQAAPAAQGAIAFGVMDTQQVLNESNVGKSLNAQWDANVKALNDDMDKKESALRAQAQQLETQRSGNPPISQADYQTKRRALEAQDAQYQQAYDKGKQLLNDRLDKARNTVTTAARKAMQEAAKARGLTVVFDRSAVPYSPEPWNITEDVIQRLNKILPNIKL